MSNEHNNAPAVPQGWKLVPIEPTLQMLRSGHDSISCVGSCGEASPPEVSDFSDVWAAMLAATPPPAPSNSPEFTAAVRTLASLGYSYHGAEYWKPPLTRRPRAKESK